MIRQGRSVVHFGYSILFYYYLKNSCTVCVERAEHVSFTWVFHIDIYNIISVGGNALLVM